MKRQTIFFLGGVLSLLSHPSYAYVDALDGLLMAHVTPTVRNEVAYNGVDYDAWAQDPRHASVMAEILATDPKTLTTRDAQLAYWINAYNVLTIDLIIREDERETIRNLGGLFSSPWRAHTWTISGTDYTLDDIEHEVIRPLGEPRIHFAINCAAKSCPDLRAEAYRAEKIEVQLEEQTRLTFENDTKGFRNDGNNTVTVTKVMDWFDEDFNKGNLNSWLRTYFPDEITAETEIDFFRYDWSLNIQ